MARRRFAVLLPGLAVILTCGLWLSARAQYLRVVCRPDGVCQANGWVGWTDYTPASVQVAGILNLPVATFAYPLYRLSSEYTAKWELIALLIGVAVQWTYIGWIADARNSVPFSTTLLRRTVGTVGILFGVAVLLATIPMYHVGLLYKAAGAVWSFFTGAVWSFFICRHFLTFFRKAPATFGH
jgi:hypothetical protein